MLEDLFNVLSDLGRSINYRFINTLKLSNQKRNKGNADLEAKYEQLEELYAQEAEYNKELHEKNKEKQLFTFKLNLENVRHEIEILKIEIRDLERKNTIQENEKEFESLSNYQRWQEDIRHRKELELISQQAKKKENELNEQFLKFKQKAELKQLRQRLQHEINVLEEQIKKEKEIFKIDELDQKKRNELELQAKKEESRHAIAILKEEIDFIKSKNKITEDEQKKLNELEKARLNEETRHKILEFSLEIEKKKLENEISEKDSKIIIERLKALLESKEIDFNTEVEKLKHENIKKLEELKFLKEKNRLTEEQLAELKKLELEEMLIDFSHSLAMLKEKNNIKKEKYSLEERKNRENDIIELLKTKGIDPSNQSQIIKELYEHRSDDIYASALFKYINKDLYGNSNFMERAIKINNTLFNFIDASLQENEEFIVNIYEHNSAIFSVIDFSLQNNVRFILNLLKHTKNKYQLLLSCNFIVSSNSEILDYVLEHDPKCIKFITPQYTNGKQKIIDILLKDNSYIKYLNYETVKGLNLGENRDFALVCLKGDYFKFKDLISDKYKGDLDFAKIVIAKNNKAVIWFNENILNDKEIMLFLINADCKNIIYIGNKLLNDDSFISDIVNTNGLYSDYKFAEKLLKIKGMYLRLFSEQIKSDKKLVLIAIKNAGIKVKEYISSKLLVDNDIIDALKAYDLNYINRQKLINIIDLNGFHGWKYELENDNKYIGDFDILIRVVNKIDNDFDLVELYTILNNKNNNISKYFSNDKTKKIIDNAIINKLKNKELILGESIKTGLEKVLFEIKKRGLNGWKSELENGNEYVAVPAVLTTLIKSLDTDLDLVELYVILNDTNRNLRGYFDNYMLINGEIAKKIKDKELLVNMGIVRKDDFFDLINFAINNDCPNVLNNYSGAKVSYLHISEMRNYTQEHIEVNQYFMQEGNGNKKYRSFTHNFTGYYYLVSIDIDKARLLKKYIDKYGYSLVVKYLNNVEELNFVMNFISEYVKNYEDEETKSSVKK